MDMRVLKWKQNFHFNWKEKLEAGFCEMFNSSTNQKDERECVGVKSSELKNTYWLN